MTLVSKRDVESFDPLVFLDDIDHIHTDLEGERLKLSLHEFVKAAWHLVEPAQEFVDNWHIREICRVLQDITFGREKGDRFIFNVPPGTMKSLLVSVLWPCWVWARKPGKRFLTASYGQHLTTRDNLRVRAVIESTWYQRMFPLQLVDDQNTKTRFNTDRGGWRIATSVGGVGTGEHPDFFLIDDPTSADQAMSEPERSGANAWFDNTVSSRGMSRKIVVIVIMQRLHEDDLTGHLLKRGGVTLICFPMRYEKCACPIVGNVDEQGQQLTKDGQTFEALDKTPLEFRCPAHQHDIAWRPDPRDPRTTHGELLFPSLIPEEKVAKVELDLGEYGTAGQMQQRPSPFGGGQFKREWFKFLTAMPKNIYRKVRGWDTAGTEGDGDWTCGVKIEEFDDGKFIVSDVVREQLGPAGVDGLFKTTAMLDGKDCPQREEKEGGSAGVAVIAARGKLLVGYDYKGIPLTGSKMVRAKPFRAQCEAGNVYLLVAEWNEEYIRELCGFPTAKHDDQVDGSSCSFNTLVTEPKRKKDFAVW